MMLTNYLEHASSFRRECTCPIGVPMEAEQTGHLRLTPPNSRGDLTLRQTSCGSLTDRLGEQLSRLCMELIRCLGIGFEPADEVLR